MEKSLGGALAVALVCAAAISAACNNGSSTVVQPTVDATTETFSGNVDAGGTTFHIFTAVRADEVDATLTDMQPVRNTPVAVGLGVPSADSSACNVSPSTVTFMQVGQLLQVNAPAGSLCVAVGDTFQLGPLTYTVQVTHR